MSPYAVGERVRYSGDPGVPLQDSYIWSVVILTADIGGERRPIGTAFAVVFGNTAYLVTAKHVIDHPGMPVFVRVRDADEDELLGEWVKLPDADVAVLPLDRLQTFRWTIGYIPESSFLPEGPEDDQVMLGQEVLFIGLLRHLDKMVQEGIPMVRTGSLGRLNQKEVPVRIDSIRHFKITGHLLDTRAYRGMSGAPCFIQRLIVRAQPDPRTGEAVTLKTVTYLLGVMSAQFDDREQVEPLTPENFGRTVRIHSGISAVTPVRFLRELLESDKLVAAREETASRERSEYEDPDTEAVAISDTGAPNRTADLMGKLLQVPKDEADEVHRHHSE
jgi:hypothetical protein